MNHLIIEIGLALVGFIAGYFVLRLSAKKVIGFDVVASSTLTDGDVKARFRFLELAAGAIAFAVAVSVGLLFFVDSATWNHLVLPPVLGAVLGVLHSFARNRNTLKRLH